MIEARTPDGATHQFPDGTPDDVVDRVVKDYIASNKQPAPAPTMGQAVGRGLGLAARDALEGTLAGPYDLIGRGMNAALGSDVVKPFSENLTAIGLPTSDTPTEKMISAVQQPVAGAAAGMGVGRAMMGAASPVVQGVGKALSSAPKTQALAAGAGGAVGEATGSPEAGLAVRMATPLGIAGLRTAGRAAERAMFPVTVPDAELGKLAVEKYKIPIATPDLTDNSMIRIGADQAGKLPLSGARPAAAAKHTAWQSAILNEMGEPGATSFTPGVMSKAAARIGQTLDDAAAVTTIKPADTATLLNDLAQIRPLAERSGIDTHLPSLSKEIRAIANVIGKNGNGTLTGEQYQTLTRTGSPLDMLEHHADTNVRKFAGKISKALDDAFARSAAPDVREAFQEARYQYRVMRTVDQLAAGSRTNDITPDGFMQAVKTASRRFDSATGGMAYTGGGNIGELARIGKLMRAAPQSGTAERALVNSMVFGGGATAALTAPGVSTVLGVPAALAANRAVGGYLRSGGLANRLIEGATGATQNSLIPALGTTGAVGLEAELQRARRNDLLR